MNDNANTPAPGEPPRPEPRCTCDPASICAYHAGIPDYNTYVEVIRGEREEAALLPSSGEPEPAPPAPGDRDPRCCACYRVIDRPLQALRHQDRSLPSSPGHALRLVLHRSR